MPIQIDWDNAQHTVIRVMFEGVWDIRDIRNMIKTGASMMESVNHDVDSIFDFTNSRFSPANLLSTADQMEETYNVHERLLIMVNANFYIKSLAKMAVVLAPKTFANVRFVSTLDDAYALILNETDKAFV